MTAALFLGFMLVQPETRFELRPAMNEETIATAGSVVFERSNYQVSGAVSVDEGVVLGAILFSVSIAAGERLQLEPGETFPSACTVKNDIIRMCLLDKDSDGRFERSRAWGAVVSRKLKLQIPYRSAPPIKETSDITYKHTLIFTGVSSGTLRFSYREFTNDMARPAFTEEVTFTMSGKYPETIAYKDLKIDVLSVGNSGLRYIIRSATQ